MVRFEDYQVDLQTGEVRKNGTKIRLSGQPFQILALLLEKPGELVTREELRARLWPDEVFVDFDHGLNAAVNKLREALCDSTDEVRFVETLPKRGYRFIGPVEVREGPAVQMVAATESDVIPPTARDSKLHRYVALALTVSMALSLIVWLGVTTFRPQNSGAAGSASIRSIAVLPFANLSGDPNQEYFAEGMTEELVTEMGKLGALRVISHTSVNRFKATKMPLQEITRELQVDAVVEGTVRREANRVRVTANLIQAHPERHLWAESYDRDLRNVLDLQSEIARTIADQIKIAVTPEERLRLTTTETVDPQAHELLLKGNYYVNKWTKEGFEKAIEYFNQSVQEEPRNARAYAGLAVAYAGIGRSGDVVAYQKEKAAALKAIEIDDTVAEAHNALAWAKFTYDWDTPSAERDFRRALELNPSDARAHAWYGIFLTMLGRNEESLQQVKATRQLDPLALANTSLAWRTYFNAGDYDKAIELCRNALEMDPHFISNYGRLQTTYEHKGEIEKAIDVMEREATLGRDNSKELVHQAKLLRKAYAANGARGYWLQRLGWLRLDADRGNRDIYSLAVVYTRLGNKDEAFRWLEKAFDEHLPYLIWIMPGSRELDGLRSDPRFHDLMRRLVPRSE